MQGLYCAHCGQTNEPLNRSLWRVAKEAFSAAIILDSRLWRTLRRLFFEPGALAAEYTRGRRTRAVKPFRLYFVVSVLFFTALAFDPREYAFWGEKSQPKVSLPFTVQINEDEPEADQSEWAKALTARVKTNRELIQEHPEWLLKQLTQRLPKAAFFMVPVLALILKLMWRQRVMIDHLIFALHAQTVAFALLMLLLLPLEVRGPLTVVSSVVFLAWFLVGLHRFYEQPWHKTLMKSGPVLSLYGIALTFGFLATLFLSVIAER